MNAWLKKCWKKLGTLSKPDIFHSLLLPAAAILFSWGVIGHLYLINIDINSLIISKGKVTDIRIIRDRGPKYTHFPLKITLINHPEQFRLPDTYKKYFPNLQVKIMANDSITLYTRHKWQTILGWGKQMDIYRIDRNGETVFTLETVKAEKKSQAILFTVFSLILWPWYIVYRYRKKHNLTPN